MSAFEKQVGGDHYKKLKIQPTQYVLANEMGFCEGNVVKYVTRYKFKNGIEDLKKARHYIDLLIESYEQVYEPLAEERPTPTYRQEIERRDFGLPVGASRPKN